MEVAIGLLLTQGALGAFDTLWYHEWNQRLPHRPGAQLELRLHAARAFAYSLIFGSLAWVAWQGWFAWVLGAVLLFEIVITLWDFIEEDLSRPLPAGERIMHTIMAIVYGAFLAHLIPQLTVWSAGPSGFVPTSHGAASWLLSAMALGVLASAVRDLVASWGGEKSWKLNVSGDADSTDA
jgi:uncharacterized protein